MGSVLGVSRTPVREALQRLEYDGLLDNRPGHSPRVTHLTLEDIDEIYPLIGVLEGLAARLAAPRLTDRDLDRMEELTNQMSRHQRRGEIDKLLRADTEFHAVLHERSQNERLKKIVAELRGQMERFEYFYFSTPKSLRVSVKRHRHLVQVLRRRNASDAQKTLLRQWELGRRGLVEVIRKKTAILEAPAGDKLAEALRDRPGPARASSPRSSVRPAGVEEILTFQSTRSKKQQFINHGGVQ